MQSNSPIGITDKARTSIARLLNHVLKEECFLLATTRDYRGSVTGPHLYSLHRLFDEQRRQLEQWLERVIERAKLLGAGKFSGKPNAQPDSPIVSRGAGLPAGTLVGD